MAAAQHSPPRAPLPAAPVPSLSRAEARREVEAKTTQGQRASPAEADALEPPEPLPPKPAPVPSLSRAESRGCAEGLSRRTLLGAALAVPFSDRAAEAFAKPLLPRHPGLDPGSSWSPAGEVEDWTLKQVQGDNVREKPTVTNWKCALAAWRRADAAIAAASHSEDEALYDRLGARHDRALVRLLRTRAPDAAAFAHKLDLAIAHRVWELTAGETCLAALQADARRLASCSS